MQAASAAVDVVQWARRASNEVYGASASNHQAPVDFRSLGLIALNCHGAQSLFWLAAGGVVFTGGRYVAHRSAADDTDEVMVNVMRVGGGAPESVAATQLLATSDAVVPGV
eukprot:3200650-Pleurochrysis_carterae.AAC.1